MSEKKRKDQVLGVDPSGYIHPDNARRLLDGETVAFRKKPYGHDGGGIPVFVGHPPVSAEPVGKLECHVSGDATFWPDESKVLALPVGEHAVYTAPVAALAQPVNWPDMPEIERPPNAQGAFQQWAELYQTSFDDKGRPVAAQASLSDSLIEELAYEHCDETGAAGDCPKFIGTQSLKAFAIDLLGRCRPTSNPVAAQAQPEDDSIAMDRLADYIADTWPMDKKYGLEEICQRLHAMWPGEFMPAVQVDKSPETQGKPVDESPDLQDQQQPVSGADELPRLEDALSAILWLERRVPQSYKGTDGNVACVADVKAHLSRLTAKDEPQLYANPVQLDNLPDATEMIDSERGAIESALAELVDKIMPGLDTGDLLADAATASKTLDSAKQDAGKADAALAEMVHAMFRSGNSVPVARITIDRKQYDAAIDAGDVAR